MSYRIDFKPSAAKHLRKLPRDVQLRLKTVIASLECDPRPIGSETIQGRDLTRRIRSGDYRVVYEIEDDVLMIFVIRIGHRRDVYRGL